MKIAIEAHRYNKPYCMGTMFWQLNDCWPVTSWSCIDYRKTPKAFYYSLKRDFNNIFLSVNEQNSQFEFRITSDTIASLSGELIVKIKDFKGKLLLERKNKTYLKANSSSIHYTLDKIWMKDIDTTSSYLTFEFKFKNKSYKTIHYFTKPKNLNLPPAHYSWKQNKNSILIKSNHLIKDLQINVNDGAMSLSDNYFDLEPNEENVIEIYSPIQFIKTINFLSLNDINQIKSP
jgi:beta-mannosidase